MNRPFSQITSHRRFHAGHIWLRAVVASMLAVACAGGRVDGEAQQLTDVTFVAVLPASATLPIGDSVAMSTVVIDGRGDTLRGPALKWQSANPAIATVSASGVVRAVAPGLAGITAESGGRTGSARVIVTPQGATRQKLSGEPPREMRTPAPDTPSQRDPLLATRVLAQSSSTGQSIVAPSTTVATRDVQMPRRGRDVGHPNEPAGFRILADRPFLTRAKRDNDRGNKDCRGGSECWDGAEFRYGKFDIVEDRTAPFSCCTIGRMTYVAGHRSGTAPATVQTRGFDPPVEELYVSIRARLSPNWHGNQSGTNKMFFLGIGRGGNNIFLSAEGVGQGPLQPQIRLQGVPDARARIRPNQQQLSLTRGKWQHWEFYFKMNDPGAPNGIAHMWIDGELVTAVADVQFRGAAERSKGWWLFHWSPTYGGGGAPPPNDQFLDFDHVYVSGR